ncbi:TetR family transcriptional regulator [Streptomyces cucumeris]|uniref:TetR/AcrR family transcriptional regulator n=1 Tax=Streptomyces cucumeris TaxID=2962890 RepID=UPI003D70558C
MNNGPRRGRRTGSPDTRTQILEVARRRFFSEGYQNVTLRSIAAEAAVDAALISYFFGSKKGLFGAVLSLSANPADFFAQALEGDLATLPQRVLRSVDLVWADPEAGSRLRAIVSGAADDMAVAALVKEALEREMVDRLAARLGGRDAHRRAGAFCAQVTGLVMTRFVFRVEPIASMRPDALVRLFTPPLRAVLLESGRRRPGGDASAPGRKRS